MKVLSIGYGRHLFKANNPERLRLESCALACGELHMIIFSSVKDSLVPVNAKTGLRLYPTNSKTRLGMLFDAYVIGKKILQKRRIEETIITTQDPFETALIGYLLKLKFKCKLNIQEHADVFSTMYWRNETALNFFRYYLGKLLLKKADSIRVVAERIKITLSKEKSLRNKIFKLPVAIDTTAFTSPIPNATVRELFTDDNFVFLSVARFVPQKNLGLMLQAFKEVYAVNNNCRLLLVGSGAEQKFIESFIANNFTDSTVSEKPVKILTWSDDVAGLMVASDAYLLTSNYEGWARVLIEAICTNLPVVTTDVGCANEVIKDHEHGLVIKIEDQTGLQTAMLQMSTDQAFYKKCQDNIRNLDKTKLPGSNISTYGYDWAQSLRAHL